MYSLLESFMMLQLSFSLKDKKIRELQDQLRQLQVHYTDDSYFIIIMKWII